MLPEFLKTGYRILMLIERNKDKASDQKRTTDRKNIRAISSCPTEFDEILAQLESMRLPNQRIYSTVNERSMPKAIRMFKERQLKNDYESEENKYAFYTDIQNRFLSCLQNPSCKASSYFLIDIDHQLEDKYEAEKEILINYSKILFECPTPNGFHVITRPFNPNLPYFIGLEIKKDDMILVSAGK